MRPLPDAADRNRRRYASETTVRAAYRRDPQPGFPPWVGAAMTALTFAAFAALFAVVVYNVGRGVGAALGGH